MDRVLFTGVSGRIGSALISRLESIFEYQLEIDILQNKKSLTEIVKNIPNSNTIKALENL